MSGQKKNTEERNRHDAGDKRVNDSREKKKGEPEITATWLLFLVHMQKHTDKHDYTTAAIYGENMIENPSPPEFDPRKRHET